MITFREFLFRRPLGVLAIVVIVLSLLIVFTIEIEPLPQQTVLEDTVVKVERDQKKFKVWGEKTLSILYQTDLMEGDVVLIHGEFVSVQRQKRPSYGRYLLSQGILYTVWNPVIQQTGEVRPLYLYKKKILTLFERRIEMRFRTESFFWKALFYGDRSEFPKEIGEGFSKMGTAHILALSGFHVGLIVLFLQFLLQWLSLRRRNVLICLFLICYSFLTGLKPPILRAVGFYLLYYVSFLLKRRYDLLSSLYAMCILILLYNPYQILDIGFQLSFLSVLSIAIFYRPLERRIKTSVQKDEKRSLWGRYLVFGFQSLACFSALSFSATILTLPLVVRYFGLMPLLSVVGNLFIIPLISLAMTFFLISLLLPCHWLLTDILVWGAEKLMYLMFSGTEYITSFRYSYLEWQRAPVLFLLLYYALCIVWYIKREKRMIKENFYDIQRIERTVG